MPRGVELDAAFGLSSMKKAHALANSENFHEERARKSANNRVVVRSLMRSRRASISRCTDFT
jgi:hypothetical protein